MSIYKEYDHLPIGAVKKVGPAVVSIVISKYLPKMKMLDPLSFFNPFMFEGEEDGARQKVKIGGGSGFIVKSDGIILTNKHVVFDEDAEYTVITNDEKEHTAKVLSRDPINDIAIVKIDAKNLPTVELSDSSELELGQTVLAIGNALGMFSNSVSKGIISGLSRSISASLGGTADHMEHLRGVIQTDVAINQGNSGGPLINLDGKAVAINTAVIFGAQNIGFSIPINWAKEDLEDIIKHGRIIKPYLGLMYAMLSEELKKKYDLPVDHGAMVIRGHVPGSDAVVPHSPADKAGVKENDIITGVEGKALSEKEDLMDRLQQSKVGDTIELTLLRHGKEHTVKVTLEERK